MIHEILFGFWFLLPAAAANVAPILSAKMPLIGKWKTPMDGGRKFRGVELLGPHKTWRGLVSGILAATLIFWLQQLAVGHANWAHDLVGAVDYLLLPTWLLGPAFGLGALGGDALESFFKRQRRIASGESWIPFDQLDYIVGSVLLSLPFVVLRPQQYVWIAIIWFVMHLLASYVGYKTGFKEKPI